MFYTLWNKFKLIYSRTDVSIDINTWPLVSSDCYIFTIKWTMLFWEPLKIFVFWNNRCRNMNSVVFVLRDEYIVKLFVVMYFKNSPFLSDTLSKLYVICTILEFYTTRNVNSIPTFREKFSVPFSKAKQSEKNSSWVVWTAGLICMSV
jgi:hypothetical protein